MIYIQGKLRMNTRNRKSSKTTRKQVKPIFATIREERNTSGSQTKTEQTATPQLTRRKRCQEGNFRQGRWSLEEHQRFVEAIIKHGNNWKLVQQKVSTRSCSQARSHAQKFFLKLRRSENREFNNLAEVDSIVSLQQFMASLSPERYEGVLDELNNIAQEKPNTVSLKKEEEFGKNDTIICGEEP